MKISLQRVSKSLAGLNFTYTCLCIQYLKGNGNVTNTDGEANTHSGISNGPGAPSW